MKIPVLDLSAQHRALHDEMLRSVERVLSCQHFILGKENESLCSEVSSYLGVPHTLGVANGSDALFLALLACGVGAGDEVITTPFSFFATASSVVRAGAKPVFADIDEHYLLSAEAVGRKITHKTKAVLPVHLYGQPCRMEELTALCRKQKLFLIEDCAQSFGALYKGRQTGTFGDAGCFSFYPTKNLGGAGDGGLVSTRSKTLAHRLAKLRNHGQKIKYLHEEIGMNSRLDEMQAAILRIKLKYIDAWNASRRSHADAYHAAFEGLPLKLPYALPDTMPIYHLYTVATPKRDKLAKFLSERGIGSAIHYGIPLHLQPALRHLKGKKGDLPQAEKACREVLSLPLYPELSQADREQVIGAVLDFFRK